MSKKVDHPELRAKLEALNNKELHHKCVEHGLNVPVADSTRDVIIRKLIKSITGDAGVASPKANKRQQATTPNEKRKTVNVTVHVSSDEEEAGRKSRTPSTKTRTRTQSPKGHNVTFDTTINNNNRRSNASATPAAPKAATQINQQQRIDTNANAGVGLSSNSRILPIEVDYTERDDYDIEVRRSGSALNRDVNLNRSVYNSTPMQLDSPKSSSYQNTTSNLGFSNYQPIAPSNAYKAPTPTLGFSQMRNTTYQQDDQGTARHGSIATTSPDSAYNRQSYGYYSPGSPPDVFNSENKASHSSTLSNQYASGSPPQQPTSQESIFKRPVALSKSNITNTSYNQADAQRLYPRLPTDLPSPPSYSATPPSSPETQHSNKRAPSLTKSGVMTTAYYQEISPVKEVQHFEVEHSDEPALLDTGAGDYERRHINTPLASTHNYERSSYLAGFPRSSEKQHLPFEPHLQSTLHDALDAAAPRYASSPLTRDSYVPRAAPKPASPTPLIKRYSANSSSNTSYTRSIDEPDSGSEAEKLSGEDEIYVQDSEDEVEEEEQYMPGNRKIYSSFGSNKIQERVPYRRSTTARLSASPSARYNHSPMGRPLINTVGGGDHDDDVNTSLRNFLTTLDRKYHIKQMLYMFAIFAAAVFVYVVFIEKTPTEDDIMPARKVQP